MPTDEILDRVRTVEVRPENAETVDSMSSNLRNEPNGSRKPLHRGG